jgi:hypothetical protein
MKCKVCFHIRVECRDADPFCSEYCATTTSEQQAEWKAAKLGDYCVYPCGECGHAIEDVLSRDRVCGSCGDEWRLKKLLRRCRRHVPETLQRAIDAATKKR